MKGTPYILNLSLIPSIIIMLSTIKINVDQQFYC